MADTPGDVTPMMPASMNAVEAGQSDDPQATEARLVGRGYGLTDGSADPGCQESSDSVPKQRRNLSIAFGIGCGSRARTPPERETVHTCSMAGAESVARRFVACPVKPGLRPFQTKSRRRVGARSGRWKMAKPCQFGSLVASRRRCASPGNLAMGRQRSDIHRLALLHEFHNALACLQTGHDGGPQFSEDADYRGCRTMAGAYPYDLPLSPTSRSRLDEVRVLADQDVSPATGNAPNFAIARRTEPQCLYVLTFHTLVSQHMGKLQWQLVVNERSHVATKIGWSIWRAA